MGRPIQALASVVALALTVCGAASAQRRATPPEGQPGAQQRPGDRAPAERAPTGPGRDDGRSVTQVPDGKLKAWFASVDTDGNSWLSLRETAAALDFDAGRFRTFDIDKDGRITLAEFGDFYAREAEAGNPPQPPRSTLAHHRPKPRRDELQLRIAFDRDLDGMLDLREFSALLAEYGQGEADARALFQRADANGDQRLDVAELTRVAVLLDPLAQSQSRAAPPIARTLKELFGAQSARGGDGQPPLIVGPVPLFWRLDIDGDGYIEDDDLALLQGRMHMPISVAAVKSALDRDGDGRISELEFAMALDPNVRPESAKPAR